MGYITANGERRWTVSVTLNEDQVFRLDELARALDRRYVAGAPSDTEEEYRQRQVNTRPTRRADALRRAIEIALERVS